LARTNASQDHTLSDPEVDDEDLRSVDWETLEAEAKETCGNSGFISEDGDDYPTISGTEEAA
jgi:hypothetical protein